MKLARSKLGPILTSEMGSLQNAPRVHYITDMEKATVGMIGMGGMGRMYATRISRAGWK